nr:hypothetical protein [Sphaerisporangium fuscum]
MVALPDRAAELPVACAGGELIPGAVVEGGRGGPPLRLEAADAAPEVVADGYGLDLGDEAPLALALVGADAQLAVDDHRLTDLDRLGDVVGEGAVAPDGVVAGLAVVPGLGRPVEKARGRGEAK